MRGAAGMFDVSHMTVVDVSGAGARAFLRYLIANDVDRLGFAGKALYSCMLNPEGGVIDDLIVYFLRDKHYRAVINSATRDKDLAWIGKQAEAFEDLEINPRDDVAVIAVQGPDAPRLCQDLFEDYQRQALRELSRFQDRKSVV